MLVVIKSNLFFPPQRFSFKPNLLFGWLISIKDPKKWRLVDT